MARTAAYQTKYHNKAAIYIVLITLFVIAVVLFVKCSELNERKAKLENEQSEQMELLEEQQQYAKELEDLEKETQTKGFKIQLARERLNLTFPDEIYYKESND